MYRIRDGYVQLSGLIKSGSSATVAIEFPKHMMPHYSRNMATVSNNAFAHVIVRGKDHADAGDMYIETGSGTWLSLYQLYWYIDEGIA